MEINNLSEDQIKQMIALLQNMLPNTQQDAIVKPKKTRKKTNKNSTESNNKFEQMQEYFLHKEDSEIDKKLSKFPPVPRTRRFEPVSVICMVCGKKDSVNPSIIESLDRYKCNKCCSR